MLRLAIPLVLVLLASGPVSLSAQVRYKDSEGVTHWVDSVDMVPEKYRAGAVGHSTAPPPPALDAEKRAEEQRLLQDQARAVQQKQLADWERAVTACTEQVRSDASNPDFATFTAVVLGPGRVKLGGSAPAQLSFDQCMVDAGQALMRTMP